ncbi:lipoprotein-releasing system permease protein [Blattabacterium sp. (Blatta orientalis) str. Tarazona]|nr:lipoprotein-releasing system permease protein [Blattabacterium sp. (Blatta orientalis) str. Tarazona]
MRTSFYITIRYFFYKKKTNIVNLIIFLSIISLSISTFSLSTILSVFSGLKDLNIKFYQNNYPDIMISSFNGKDIFFHENVLNKKMRSIKGIMCFSKTMEKKVFFHYKNEKYFFHLKGVDSKYEEVMNQFKKITFQDKNDKNLSHNKLDLYVGLSSIFPFLFMDKIEKDSMSISFFSYKKNSFSIFNAKKVRIKGLFHFNQEIDQKYLFCDIQNLIKKNAFHSLEIKIHQKENIDKIKKILKKKFGQKFRIKTRTEEERAFYKVINTEKIFIYFLFSLITVMTAFNLIGAIFILQLDKRENIFLLWSFGYSLYRIRRIFFYIGVLISVFGWSIGVLATFILSLLQERYHLFKIGRKIPFPMKFTIEDFVMMTCIILIVGLFISFISSKKIEMNYSSR